jgi:hypothetical protein
MHENQNPINIYRRKKMSLISNNIIKLTIQSLWREQAKILLRDTDDYCDDYTKSSKPFCR